MQTKIQASDPTENKRYSSEKRQRKQSSLLPLLSILLISLSGCTAHQQSDAPTNGDQSQTQTVTADGTQQQNSQADVLTAQRIRAKKVELIFSAPVCRILPDDTKGLPHQLFLVQLANGTSVKVAHDTKYAPKVPIQVGDTVTIKGEYIWNRKGGVIHWTHHSDTPRHEGGYIDFGGKRYE